MIGVRMSALADVSVVRTVWTFELNGYISHTLNLLIMVSREIDFSHTLENTSLNILIFFR